MSALEPIHPGETIRCDCIEECGLTIAEAAAHMGVDERALTEVCHTRAPLTADLAIRIELAFGRDSQIWLALQADYDLAQARKQAGDLQIARVPVPDPESVATD